MLEQVTGAASVAVVVLAYLLLVECLAAAIVVLAEFLYLRLRALWSLLPSPQEGAAVQPQGEEPAYRIGGGLMRW